MTRDKFTALSWPRAKGCPSRCAARKTDDVASMYITQHATALRAGGQTLTTTAGPSSQKASACMRPC
jgi:hypothetical protein